MRVGRKIKQDILTHVRGEIDQLRARQLMMDGEGVDLDVITEGLEAAHAFHFDRLDEIARYPKRAFRDPEIERITQRPGADDVFRGEFGNRTFLFAFEMQAISLDLAEVDLHKKMTN